MTASAENHGRIRARLLAVIAVAVVLYLLKLSAPVTLPLAFAVFLIALFWPLQRRLQHHMRDGLALAVTLLVFLLLIGAFCAAVWFSTEQVAQKSAQYEDQFRQLYEQVQARAQALGVSLPGASDGQSGGRSEENLLTRLGTSTFAFLGGLVLVVAYLALGLLEVTDFREKFARTAGHRGTRFLRSARRIAKDFQRYMVLETIIAVITGTACGLVCWAFGLDFAFIWGFINFILNYIPTLGSIVGVLPPTLFALVQFGLTWKALLVFLGVSIVQFVMGNYVGPLIQGKYLELSPLVVLVSVAFWGWIWGIAGAFIGIPLTVAVVIACRQSERTRWIATLLADLPNED